MSQVSRRRRKGGKRRRSPETGGPSVAESATTSDVAASASDSVVKLVSTPEAAAVHPEVGDRTIVANVTDESSKPSNVPITPGADAKQVTKGTAETASHNPATVSGRPTNMVQVLGVNNAEEQAALVAKAKENPEKFKDFFVRHKRKPVRTEKGPRHIFVTRASRFGALLARAMQLLQTDPAPVTIHGLGAAITRACDLALAVQESAGGHVILACKTDTVLVYDDFQPIVPGLPIVTKCRRKSALHITISRTKEFV